MGVGGGRVAEEGGDVDGVGGEVPEVEGVEVECCFGLSVRVSVEGNGREVWVGLGSGIPRTISVATR